jgi:hypothetical protein
MFKNPKRTPVTIICILYSEGCGGGYVLNSAVQADGIDAGGYYNIQCRHNHVTSYFLQIVMLNWGIKFF